MTSIVVVGLGSMGYGIARNLLTAGFDVRGNDICESTVEAFKADGGSASTSVLEAAIGADVLLLMVVNSEQAISVLSNKELLQTLSPSAVVVLMATCPVSDVVSMHDLVKKSGLDFIDAPVSGGQKGANSATLTIMAAATTTIFKRVKPVFKAIGKRIFHVGERPGQGSMMKTVNQLLCGVNLAAAGEALALAKKSGLDLDVVLSILRGSSASSWMLNDRGPRMLLSDPPVTSTIDIFVKDLGIVLDVGRMESFSLPVAAAAHQMFIAASGRGHGNKDDSRIIDNYEVLTTIKK